MPTVKLDEFHVKYCSYYYIDGNIYLDCLYQFVSTHEILFVCTGFYGLSLELCNYKYSICFLIIEDKFNDIAINEILDEFIRFLIFIFSFFDDLLYDKYFHDNNS